MQVAIENRKGWNKNKKNENGKTLCREEYGDNEPLMMLVFYMDAEDKQWSIHRYTRHMGIDSTVRYRMLLNTTRNKYTKMLFISSFRSDTDLALVV